MRIVKILNFARTGGYVMDRKKHLNALSLNELYTLLAHIKKGVDYLRDYLSVTQFKRLLALEKLSEKQKNKVATDAAEKSGNAILVVNSIITSIIGTWLGTISFLGLKIQSIHIVIAFLLFSGMIGLYLGYINYQLVKKKAEKATAERVLLEIQLKILNIANKKIHKNIKKIINSINKNLGKLFSPIENHLLFNGDAPLKQHLVQWQQLVNANILLLIERHSIMQYTLLLEKIEEIRKNLNILFLDENTYEILRNSPHSSTLILQQKKKSDPLNILSTPSTIQTEIKLDPLPWWKTNIKEAITNLAPTALGGLSFLFIYLDGLPKTINEMGIKNLQILFMSPLARNVELFVGLSITFYFAFIHLYNHYKTIKRNKEIQTTENKINNLEAKLTAAQQKLGVIKKINSYLTRLVLIFELFNNSILISDPLDRDHS